MLKDLFETYGNIDCQDIGSRQLTQLRDGLKTIQSDEIQSSAEGHTFIDLLYKFRKAVAENDKLHGENYPQLLNSILSVGEDGLYSNNLRFIFELIQNVDDCDYNNLDDCRLDMQFKFDEDEIVLTYNEVGFTPFNVFAITGIAEAAKNISSSKNEIGEKGIGFKSVFGVANKVLIRSGWFAFFLNKENFTIPIAAYGQVPKEYVSGTEMTLYVPGKSKEIYGQIKNQYCKKEALFSRNPLLFLNKLTALNIYFDAWRRMEFRVSKKVSNTSDEIQREDDITIYVDLHDYDNGYDTNVVESFKCARYTLPVLYTQEACRSRYGEKTKVGSDGGKGMFLQAVLPYPEYVNEVGNGSLYSFLPTQLKLTVPILVHVPFKLDASREFVDPQDENRWFTESVSYLSKLMDYVYEDWCKTAANNIIYYIPGARESLFAKNNGKEKCLSENKKFQGSYYLKHPIFITTDNNYEDHQSIFCFNPDENIMDQDKLFRMIHVDESLFVFPGDINPRKYDIKILKNAYLTLFKTAFSNPAVTENALNYLDAVGFMYYPKDIPENESLKLTCKQIETIMQHEELAKILMELTGKTLRQRKDIRIALTDVSKVSISEVIENGFDASETPQRVERYLQKIDSKCVCLGIRDNQYLPCNNVLVLSDANPISSLASLCFSVDEKDTFAIRIKLKEASERLNQYTDNEAGSANDYLRELRNIRLTVRDSLGSEGYKSYINLILRSGTERKRFLQELIQNADDCEYDENVVPSFMLRQDNQTIITEYNEKGFTRENIRSITAIGESTKNRLLNGEYLTIGEKGVGFKTIFAVASEVRISSGDYHFLLTDKEPTIPKAYKENEGTINGTRMRISLKESRFSADYNEKMILELCLCLRQLKDISIGAHRVTIEDTDDTRTLTVDGRKQTFRKFIHEFIIDDPKAIAERETGTRKITPQQRIVCYVPERLGSQEYSLYCGLPTRHKTKIPVAIDAPFELTTSREQIEEDCEAWNGKVRQEVYAAIKELILSLRAEHRVNVLRFVRYVPRLKGKVREYVNDIFDSPYLTNFDFLNILRNSNILPTYNHEIFAASNRRTSFRFPEVAHFLFQRNCFGNLDPSIILDINGKDYEAPLNALECESTTFDKVFPLLENYSENYIHEDEYGVLLYEYLQQTPDQYTHRVAQLAIIPVYGTVYDSTRYVRWEKDKIFVKKNTKVSPKDYFILREDMLSKSFCEKMIGENINEMNEEWERRKYDEKIREILAREDITDVYYMILSEFQSGDIRRNYPSGLPINYIEMIPLRNRMGEIICKKLFLCKEESEYFPVDIIRKITVSDECAKMAQAINCTDIADAHYEDFEYNIQLTDEDVETLLDDYFHNSEEILRGFYQDGLLSDDLLSSYNLDYLAASRVDESGDRENFPEDPVTNRDQLRNHIKKQFASPVHIVPVVVERTVHRGQDQNGNLFELQSRDIRDGVLRIYSSTEKHGICFCQMCGRRKSRNLIEVNNLQRMPKIYFPQMRVALCLECSKIFEALRNNDKVRNTYLDAIRNVKIGLEGKIDIPIGIEERITFTAKHLAEIQEILKRYSDN